MIVPDELVAGTCLDNSTDFMLAAVLFFSAPVEIAEAFTNCDVFLTYRMRVTSALAVNTRFAIKRIAFVSNINFYSSENNAPREFSDIQNFSTPSNT